MSTGQANAGATVRVGPMVSLSPLLASLGCRPESVFALAEVAAAEFEDPNNRIPYPVANRLLTECRRATGLDQFGLLLGARSEPWHLGLSGLVTYAAPRVREGLEALIELLALHDEGGAAALEAGPEYAKLSFSVHEQDVSAIEIINDLSAAMMCRILRTMCGERWTPSAVSIARRTPADAAPYTRYFRAPLYFNSAEISISFDNRWLEHRPRNSDTSRYDELKQTASLAQASIHPGLISHLAVLIRRGLLTGEHTAGQLAERLGLHERTLHRRLTTLDTNFRRELDLVRWSFSRQLLHGTDMPIRDIAVALAYSQTSSFIRAFERWSDMSPGSYRRQCRSGTPQAPPSRRPSIR